MDYRKNKQNDFPLNFFKAYNREMLEEPFDAEKAKEFYSDHFTHSEEYRDTFEFIVNLTDISDVVPLKTFWKPYNLIQMKFDKGMTDAEIAAKKKLPEQNITVAFERIEKDIAERKYFDSFDTFFKTLDEIVQDERSLANARGIANRNNARIAEEKERYNAGVLEKIMHPEQYREFFLNMPVEDLPKYTDISQSCILGVTSAWGKDATIKDIITLSGENFTKGIQGLTVKQAIAMDKALSSLALSFKDSEIIDESKIKPKPKPKPEPKPIPKPEPIPKVRTINYNEIYRAVAKSYYAYGMKTEIPVGENMTAEITLGERAGHVVVTLYDKDKEGLAISPDIRKAVLEDALRDFESTKGDITLLAKSPFMQEPKPPEKVVKEKPEKVGGKEKTETPKPLTKEDMLKNSLEKVKKAASNLKHGKSIKPFKITRNAYAKIKRSENPYSSLYNLSVVDGTGYLIHQKDLFLNDIPKAIKEVINEVAKNRPYENLEYSKEVRGVMKKVDELTAWENKHHEFELSDLSVRISCVGYNNFNIHVFDINDYCIGALKDVKLSDMPKKIDRCFVKNQMLHDEHQTPAVHNEYE